MSKLKDYKLRFRLLVDSNDDIVMRWLWKYSIRDRYKEYLMPCLKACWLPRALMETQATNKERANRVNAIAIGTVALVRLTCG